MDIDNCLVNKYFKRLRKNKRCAMDTRFQIVLLFGTIIIFIHITGIVILAKSSDRNIFGTQKYLIIALSLTELGFVVLSVIRESIYYGKGSRTDSRGLWVGVYILIVIMNMYYFVMFAITLDRFLEIRLNLKYHLYSNKRRTKMVLISVYTIINVVFATCLYIFSAQGRATSKITKYFIIYFAPVFDTIFLIFATIVYSYIFSKLYKNKKKEEALRKQITVNKQYGPIVFKVGRFCVPFCIVLTFVLFVIFPNILEMIRKIYSLHPKYEKHFQMLSYALYRIGFITDPMIYIYNLHVVKNKLRKFQKNFLNLIKRYL